MKLKKILFVIIPNVILGLILWGADYAFSIQVNNPPPASSSGGSESDPLALKIANNLSDLNNTSTARANLLGTDTSPLYGASNIGTGTANILKQIQNNVAELYSIGVLGSGTAVLSGNTVLIDISSLSALISNWDKDGDGIIDLAQESQSLSASILSGTDTTGFTVTTPGMDIVFTTAGTGGVRINNGTVSTKIQPFGWEAILPGTATGAAYITIGTATVPAGALGAKGWFEFTGILIKDGTTDVGDLQILIYDGVGTTTRTKPAFFSAANQSARWYWDLQNQGSTTRNILGSFSSGFSLASSVANISFHNINTNNTMTVYIQGSCTSHNLGLQSGRIKYYYDD